MQSAKCGAVAVVALLALAGCRSLRAGERRPTCEAPRLPVVRPNVPAKIPAKAEPPAEPPVAPVLEQLADVVAGNVRELAAVREDLHSVRAGQLSAAARLGQLQELKQLGELRTRVEGVAGGVDQALAELAHVKAGQWATGASAATVASRAGDFFDVAARIAPWIAGAAGVGGLGLPAVVGVGLWLIRRAVRRGGGAVSVAAGAKPVVVTVENPPPRQAVIPENRYVAVERDSFADAHAWAAAELARKYPGAVGTLEALGGLIDQYLSSKGVRKDAVRN